MEKSQFASGVCGVGPAESTGKPRSRYCPGGMRSLSSLFWRRPRNPREKNPSFMSSPPVLVSLGSCWSAFYHVQTFSPPSRRATCSLPFFLIAHSQTLFFNFLAQFEDTFNQGLRAGRAAGDID